MDRVWTKESCFEWTWSLYECCPKKPWPFSLISHIRINIPSWGLLVSNIKKLFSVWGQISLLEPLSGSWGRKGLGVHVCLWSRSICVCVHVFVCCLFVCMLFNPAYVYLCVWLGVCFCVCIVCVYVWQTSFTNADVVYCISQPAFI